MYVCMYVCVHYTTTLLPLCSRIWRYWTCKIHVECVSKILAILSVICFAIDGVVCIQLAHLSYYDCENTCIFIIKFDVSPVCHCLGLGHETMVCVVCLSIFSLTARTCIYKWDNSINSGYRWQIRGWYLSQRIWFYFWSSQLSFSDSNVRSVLSHKTFYLQLIRFYRQ